MTTDLPMILAEVEVASVQQLSPSFVRVELAGPELADFGTDGPRYDQRFKMVFPDPGTGRMADVSAFDASWWDTWSSMPTEERGHMRTYTVRDVRGQGAETRLVVDMVLHDHDGVSGPGGQWAAQASPGDRIAILAPRRDHAFGGIEFVPPAGAELLLVGDETATPAVCSILELLPESARGVAFLEVPESGDVLSVRRPAGVEVVWLPRDGLALGVRLSEAVVAHFGGTAWVPEVAGDEVDPDLWETPTYSSSGEDLEAVADSATTYVWIAGESQVVTGLRRHLVREVGLDRSHVAFMGYWRRGVAMKS